MGILTKILHNVKLNNIGIVKVHPDTSSIIDANEFDNINQYKWYIIKQHGLPYAARKVTTNGKIHWVRMHRQIMHTPKGQVVHHKNRNTLDNRKINLVNVTDQVHKEIHIDPFKSYEETTNNGIN